jgi:cyclophilin family peptidyl-prolyl cis-trans isomerase
MLYYLIIILLAIIFIYIILKKIKFTKGEENKVNKESKENKENKENNNIKCKVNKKDKKNEEKINQNISKSRNNKPKNNKKHIIKHIKKLQREHKKFDKKQMEKKSNEVYLLVEMNGEELGKLKIRLFDDIVPKTCENFRQLCHTKKYIYSPFHRIIKDFMIQGGDFTNYDGTGGESIYGGKFPDENFHLKHDRPYLLSMANSGPNTNKSQFFITTSETPHLDGKHVVFGEIIGGFDIIYELNNIDTDNRDRPINKIVISDCGIISN